MFLIHFSICLLVNAVVNHFWHGSVTAAVVGIPFAFVLSLTAGYALYQLVGAMFRHGVRPCAGRQA